MLNTLLGQYVFDSENPIINYKLGLEYEKIGQTAAAISYFLRASERTKDKLLTYECIIRIGNCFDRQQDRNFTVKSMYRLAITVMPNRPEAYYLMAKYFDFEKNYSESYLFCKLAFNNCAEKSYSDLNVGYPGMWAVYYQYAIASWWCGKNIESRKIYQKLINDHWSVMDDIHKQAVETNIRIYGSGPRSHSVKHYTKDKYKNLRYKFPGSQNIEKNFSQVYQDMFVISMLDGKRDGTFLEIGSADGIDLNNTYLLEKDFGWKGICIEYDEKFIDNLKAVRTSKILHQDALQIDYESLLKENFNSDVIDYLQLDIDPSINTYQCLLKIPFDKFKFRVITYEHDYYADVNRKIRDMSRDYLRSKGYVLAVNDISPDDTFSFEDWWIHPDYVDQNIKNKMMNVKKEFNQVEEYFLTSQEDVQMTKDDTKQMIVEAHQKYDDQLCWGWCSLDKSGCFIDYIDDICNRVENPVCVEVGVFGGKSILPVALELKRHKKGKLYAIDPWKNDEAGKGYESEPAHYQYWTTINLEYMYNFFLGLLEEYEVKDYVEVLRMTSDDAPGIDDIDFLFIDGQHTDQAVKDALKYATKVKLNGYCVVDDVTWGSVGRVPEILNQLGFFHIHTVDSHAMIFRRTNIVNFLKEEENIFNINTVGMAKRAFVVDNFYTNPMAIRKFAQAQEYVQGGLGRGFIGKRSVQQFLFPGIKETFEAIMGKKITAWREHGMNGRFQLNIGGEQLVYHCDSQKYAAMIYLTPNAPPSCGTSTFMHKKSGVHHNSDPRINEVFVGIKTTMDRTPYENVDKFGNIFNRLVIFDGGCIHAASDYFGADMEDGRLWHMFFFDAE